MNKDSILEFFALLIIFILIILLITESASGYTEDTTIINGDNYYIYSINTSEVPLEFNKTFSTLTFIPYNETIGNVTTQYNNTDYYFECGEYLECPTHAIVNSTYKFNATIDFDEQSVGEYSSYVIIKDKNHSIVQETFITFLLALDPSAYHYQSYEFQPAQNEFNYVWYNGVLPRTKVNIHSIKTQPNETLYLKCNGFLKCEFNQTPTTNQTFFKATLTVPDGTALGTYVNTIEATTSYNKSGNITYNIEILKTPVEIIHKEIAANKPLANMTQEELRDFFESVGEFSDRKVLELDASNKTKEKIVTKEVPTPYLANKDEIISSVVQELNKKQSNQLQTLASMNENLIYSYENLSKEKSELVQTLKNLSSKITDSEIQHIYNLKKMNQSLYDKNVVVNKSSLFKNLVILIIVSTGLICYIIIDRKSTGF